MTIHAWEKEDYENNFRCPGCGGKYGHHRTKVCKDCEECSKCCSCKIKQFITAKEMINIIKSNI